MNRRVSSRRVPRGGGQSTDRAGNQLPGPAQSRYSSDRSSDTLRNHLPSAWKCQDDGEDIRRNGPLHLKRNTRRPTNLPVLVVTDKSIPFDILRRISANKGPVATDGFPSPVSPHQRAHSADGERRLGPSRNHTIGGSTSALPSGAASLSIDSFYFEITVLSPGTVCIGLVPADSPHVRMSPRRGTFPGALPGSIGVSSDGALFVSGQPRQSWTEPFRSGDTVGCGVEIANEEGNNRIFFTKNGHILFLPAFFRGVKCATGDVIPAVGIMSDKGEVKGNFGLEESFRWDCTHGIRYFSPDEAVVSPRAGNHRGNTIYRAQDAFQFGRPADRSVRLEDADDEDPHSGPADRSWGDRDTEPSASSEMSDASLKQDTLRSEFVTTQLSSTTQEAEDMRTAIERSKTRDASYLQQLSIEPKVVEDAKGFARELRACCESEHVDVSMMQNLLEVCKSQRHKIQTKLEEAMKFDDVNVEELITINSMLWDAINEAESKVAMGRPPHRQPISHGTIRDTQAQSNDSREKVTPPATTSFEVKALVGKKDVFSLICMLRSQNVRRLDSAWALMRFVQKAERESDPDALRLRDEIQSSGGMHSLLTVFRAKGVDHELQVVAAIAISYLLPSAVQSSSLLSSNISLKIIECLRFLIIMDAPFSRRGKELTKEEMNDAALAGTMTLWNYVLFPLINQETPGLDPGAASRVEHLSSRSQSTRRYRPALRITSSGDQADEIEMKIETQALLEGTVSLVVGAARLDSESTNPGICYTLIEQMCAVGAARPIAIREGLLKVLVGWLKADDRDQIRCAATSMRNFTSTSDKYMAGWIHSQIVNEGALTEMAAISVSESVGQDVRLAVTEILSSLCGAPQTRAAVVEANCINYLIPLVMLDHSDPLSQQIVFVAGSALLQLLSGAMARASICNINGIDSSLPNAGNAVISDIVEGGAIDPIVRMACADESKLRSMAIDALLVLSEDVQPSRNTRLRLCSSGAGRALGAVLKGDTQSISVDCDQSETYRVLCSLSNLLDVDPSDVIQDYRLGLEDPRSILERCCVQIVHSGGLQRLLSLSQVPLTNQRIQSEENRSLRAVDLVAESCHCLASLSQLLLSDLVASEGYSAWARPVLVALTKIWKDCVTASSDNEGLTLALGIDALRGIGALATCEPLQVRIIDSSLPDLLQTRLSREKSSEMSDAAGQVVASLGFTEDEVAVQVAGNDPNLLADWFYLNRSLMIQSMARDEIRMTLEALWTEPLKKARARGIIFSPAGEQTTGHSELNNQEEERPTIGRELFELLSDDSETAHTRRSILEQYFNIYGHDDIHTSTSRSSESSAALFRDSVGSSLLSGRSFPLNTPDCEKDWILSHRCYLEDLGTGSVPANEAAGLTIGRLRRVLDPYIPSRALQNDILPVCNLRPDASFNFRALAMPQRRYFSFQREGQLLRRLCYKNMESAGTSAIHWTVGFINSTFAGEFSDTLVTALYRCPMVRGLSFTRTSDSDDCNATRSSFDGDEGAGLLANIAGSLPPGVSCLTYDNVLNNRAVESLAAILETVDKLSEGQVVASHQEPRDFDRATSNETVSKQGSFWFFALRNSPYLDPATWASFFRLLGRPPKTNTAMRTPPLASLRVLDLSGNNLDDDQCGFVLHLVHDRYSRCCLEQLDLSRNSIREGKQVARVLRNYVEKFRFNQTAGVRMSEKSWKSALHTLSLSANKLHEGTLALEIFALLKNNALSVISLDLSENSLANNGYQVAEVLGGALVKNTRIRHLDLSKNCFDADFTHGLLQRLCRSESDSSLGFLRLENNSPPLSKEQLEMLVRFGSRCRMNLLERYLRDQGETKHGRDSLLEAEDDESFAVRQSFVPAVASSPNDQRVLVDDSLGDLSIESNGMKRAPSGGTGENTITVLFSAPLVYADEHKRLRPFAKLDFEMEREILWQCLKEASRDIDLSFDNAVIHRLQATVAKRCSCLHFSGHGHQSFLPLENGKGGPHWLEVDILKELITKGGGAPFKFVFVSTCYSGLAGETFASAGVPHVVCCQQESELKDAAALAFTRQFYLALAVGHTVRDSFDQGCKAVRATPNIRNADDEMKKFVLLPRDGNHDVPVFDARPISDWPRRSSSRSGKRTALRRGGLSRSRSNYLGGTRTKELSVRNMIQENPSPTPPQCFTGREVDMFHILGAVLENRLVSVVGEQGVGRSSTSRALCHYINERKNTMTQIERIYFVRVSQGVNGDRCNAVVRQLLQKMTQDKKLPPPPVDLDMNAVFDGIWRYLKHGGALIVFDRVELFERSDDMHDFVVFLIHLFQETHKNVRVLLTGLASLGIPSIGGVTERPYKLGPLNFESTVRLFTTLCPHLHTPSERKRVFSRLVSDSEEADLYPASKDAPQRVKKLFHLLGDGIPARIEQVASVLSSEQVRQLEEDR